MSSKKQAKKRSRKITKNGTSTSARDKDRRSRKKGARRETKAAQHRHPLQVILVPGMHRSGTSPVTRALNLLGASLPGNLLCPMPNNNETGFWESRTLMELHDELLEELASSWDDPTPFPESWLESSAARRYEAKIVQFLSSEFPDSPLCVIKDPRTCRFLGLWESSVRKAGAEPLAVIPYRHPVEVARSLKDRDKLPTAHSYLIWLRHVLLAERDTRSMKRAFVDYGRFLDDWQSNIKRITRQLGIIWPCNVLKANNDIDNFLERRQRHHSEAPGDLDARDDVPEWAKRIYKVLPRLEADPADAGAMREFDRVRQKITKADAAFSPVLRAYRDTDAELKRKTEQLQAELSEQSDQLTDLHNALDQKSARAQQLETELSEKNDQLTDLHNALDQKSARAQQLEGGLSEQEKKHHDLQRVIAMVMAGNNAEKELGSAAAAAGSEPVPSDTAPGKRPGHGRSSNHVLGSFLSGLGAKRTEERIRLRRLRKTIADSGLFDREFYAKNNWDVVQHGLDPLRHYLRHGAAEGRWPNPLFDNDHYIQQLGPDELSGLNPLAHFIEQGARRGINPHPLFDIAYYLRNYPDVSKAGLSPLQHYLRFGWKEHRNPSIYFQSVYYEAQLPGPMSEIGNPLVHYLEKGANDGLDPHPLFSTEYYLSQNSDVREAEMNPLMHYVEAGFSEGRDPHPLFDTRFYLGQFQDDEERPSEPLRHYLEYGAVCGLDPNRYFDSAFYLAQNPDVVDAKLNPLLHYVLSGAKEGRPASRLFDTKYYLEANPDVAEAGVNPLFHFFSNGLREGRKGTDGASAEVHQPVARPAAAVETNRLRERDLCPHLEMPVPPEVQLDPRKAESAKLIAFYLPQFHPIPENDEWWGAGFTEWRNLIRGHSAVEGPFQPELPGELGFYDLRLPEVRQQQADLARAYGIDAFCYHYYWFNGKKLLSRPLDEVLATGKPDFPFCICWANENWTRRWDGLDQEILIAQRHNLRSDREFILDVLPLLEDRRYLRVHGRPLLLVYRPELFKNPAETAAVWRDECLRAGVGDLHLCAVQFLTTDPRALGFDATVEFPPHRLPARNITSSLRPYMKGFQGNVHDLTNLIKSVLESNVRVDYPLYRGVMPGWSNLPRRLSNATIYAGGSPAHYAAWLRAAMSFEQPEFPDKENLIFINAWNEWAEGAVLEPSLKQGRLYLEATRDARDCSKKIEDISVSPSRVPGHGHKHPAPQKVPQPGRAKPTVDVETTARTEPASRTAAPRADSEADVSLAGATGETRNGNGSDESESDRFRSKPGLLRSAAAWVRGGSSGIPILVVSHDAALAGAQIVALGLLEELSGSANIRPHLLLCGEGVLEQKFRRLAKTASIAPLMARGQSRDQAIQACLDDLPQPALAICNTAAVSDVVEACRKRSIPTISYLHELPTTINSMLGGRATMRRILDNSDQIIVVSDFVRTRLSDAYDVPLERLRRIYLGLLPHQFANGDPDGDRRRIIEEFGFPEDVFLVMGCGSVHHRKGTDLFVQMAKHAMRSAREPERLRFLWIGEDQSGPTFREWCLHDVTDLGLDGHVVFAGRRDDPAPYYNAANAFALTSREDPFPIVNLEAMAAELPVVAFSGAGGASEALLPDCGICVPFLDTRGFGEAIASLANDPERARKMGNDGGHRIRHEFSWERYARQFREVMSAVSPATRILD